jgi:CheY-like chemotaxis protein
MAANILIADDYEDNRELLRLLLVAAEYKVIEARNGAECLKMARQLLPDLIMVDLSMPVLDGWEMIRALRADELTASILCIAVTAHGDTDHDGALRAGFDAYLCKPFRGAELLETTARLLSSRPAGAYSAESSLPRVGIGEPLLEAQGAAAPPRSFISDHDLLD